MGLVEAHPPLSRQMTSLETASCKDSFSVYQKMFTFEKQKQGPLFYIGDKPVYTTFKKDETKRIPPYRNPNKYLDSDEFRERYTLSVRESRELKKALHSNIVPDGVLKSQFYRIRKDLNERLYTEKELRETDKEITWRFPQNVKEWPETQIIIGSSGVGKTYKIVQVIIVAL